jgi:short-subunit dehydrogenase
MNRLKGKYALITGGSQGLGRQLAIDFAREGAAGISSVARRIVSLNEVGDGIYEIHPSTKLLVIAADMSRQEDIIITIINKLQSHPVQVYHCSCKTYWKDQSLHICTDYL